MSRKIWKVEIEQLVDSWKVKMEQLVDSDKLDHDDRLDFGGGPAGTILTYEVPGDDLEDAKDYFHDHYAIACLDDWEITFEKIT